MGPNSSSESNQPGLLKVIVYISTCDYLDSTYPWIPWVLWNRNFAKIKKEEKRKKRQYRKSEQSIQITRFKQNILPAWNTSHATRHMTTTGCVRLLCVYVCIYICMYVCVYTVYKWKLNRWKWLQSNRIIDSAVGLTWGAKDKTHENLSRSEPNA